MRARIVLGAVALATGACASLIDLESIRYEDAQGEAGVPDATSPGDAANADACTGATCGARCCRGAGTCLDPDAGTCSNDVIDVSGGGNGSCAVTADGTVWCWGENTLGQVGVSDAGDSLCSFIASGKHYSVPCRTTPTRVAGMPPAVRVGTGYQAACAIEADGGNVWCWGANGYGLLGHDPASDPICKNLIQGADPADAASAPSVPCNATPQLVPNTAGAVEVATAGQTACARRADGGVICWGQGTGGELGNDAGADSVTPVSVQGLGAAAKQIDVALYSAAFCATLVDGTANCWGTGLANEPDTRVAHLATGGSDAGPFSGVAEVHELVGSSGCVLDRGGAVSCWGKNDVSQLALGYCDNVYHAPGTAIALPSLTTMSARWLHACGLDADGTVYCWGIAVAGALGTGMVSGPQNCASGLLSLATPAVVPNVPPMKRISTGILTTFAIDKDGALWEWGANDFARLGHAPKTAGDFTSCGDPANETTCNVTPRVLELK